MNGDYPNLSRQFGLGGLVYLATPYSRYMGGMQQAFEAASRLAAYLIKRHVTVYSPIAHSHPIAEYGEIPHTDPMWYTFNHKLMDASNHLLVALMPGWDNSRGIDYERGYFAGQGKYISYIHPKTYDISTNVSDLLRHPIV